MTLILKKLAFNLLVLLLTLIFLFPAYFLKELLIGGVRGPDGIYRGGDGLIPGLLTVSLAAVLANWLSSYFFWKVGLSEDRWSVFRSR